MVYVPSASEAYHSLERLNYEQQLGWVLRGIHYWGSACMVILMILHMTQVFLWGAYKYPREMTWLSGCALLFITLGLAFSGQVIRFDTDAYWGLGIGVAVLGRFPFIGDALAELRPVGLFIWTKALSHVFSLNVF